MKLSKSVITVVCILILGLATFVLPSTASTLYPTNSINQEYYLMGFFDNLFNKGAGETKKVEGRLQEEAGKVTDNPTDQIVGKAKQVQGETMNKVDDFKQEIEKATDAAGKNLQELGDKAAKAMEDMQK
jgi:uncharacterized protein YjbJ (UPF0337 family)